MRFIFDVDEDASIEMIYSTLSTPICVGVVGIICFSLAETSFAPTLFEILVPEILVPGS
jgi:hypothetical protein